MNQQTGNRSRFMSFMKDERLRVALSLFMFVAGAFFLFAFVSYFFTWQVDQSFYGDPVISPPSVLVDNWAGKAGAAVSVFFIQRTIGLAAFFLPFFIFFTALYTVNIRLLPFWRTLRVMLMGAILASIVLGFVFGDAGGFLGSGPGGVYGLFMSAYLSSFIGQLGTGLFLFVVLFTYLVFSFPSLYLWLKQQVVHVSNYFFSSSSQDDIVRDERSDDLDLEGEAEEETPTDETHAEMQADDDESTDHTDDDDIDFNIQHPIDTEQEIEVEESGEVFVEEKVEGQIEDREEEVGMEVEAAYDEEQINKKSHVLEDYDPTLDLSSYKLPPLYILADHEANNERVSDEELVENKRSIVKTLENYKIKINKILATIGPTVTLYEIIPAPGIRISKIKNLEDDIALSLAALGIRIIAPMPGKGTIGIEVPNSKPQVVSMRAILSSKKFTESKADLAVAIGRTISNETFVFDLAKMPHILVAGATGQGKSVGLNAIITSLLYKKHPAQLKFVFIDPKKVELSIYSQIESHFLAKLPDEEDAIITDVQKVIYTLNSLCIEMDSRYDLLKKAHVRNIKEYNAKFIARKLNPENGHMYLPYIVLVIDEFADLIVTAGKEVETPIARLAQLARAIGIHLIIATQRPSANVITGIIKANFPARIAFRTMSSIDSRTILDSQGANQLIGRGDMLISMGSEMTRIQCAFIDTPEVDELVGFIGEQQSYPTPYYLPEYKEEDREGGKEEADLSKRDDLFEDAARMVVVHQQGSTSLIQRKFSIGYNRAGRIVDQLEAAQIVGPFEGSKARRVLVSDEMTLDRLLEHL